ncbi:MAG: 1-acyl-sn-glycerol-3-phosphate acyltransferase [Dehalococcoidales bacterium]|nr:1-acyl-sn-glycerol-3-phosphate acyltransferase [Dehalococcoidales bacterium]
MIRWYYYIARWFVIRFLRIVTRLRIEGLDNIPPDGPVLLVSNHLSNADPPLISVTLRRNAMFMAKQELFANRILGYLIYGLGAFPVNRGQLDRKALRHAEGVLSQNKILVMFPEARRSKAAQLQEAFPGSALIATRHDVPIVPVAISGTEKMTNWRFIYRRYPIKVTYGKPFHLPDTGAGGKRKNLEAATLYIMEQIAGMLPERYRGVYSKTKVKE